jgi:cation diffusion facilitator family transporter
MLDRSRELVRASYIGIVGNLFLAAAKIIVGFLAGSFAVISDGIDTFIDILTYLITLIASKIISKPPDLKYPFGYKKAETVATKLLSFVIFFAGAQLLVSSVKRIVANEPWAMPGSAALIVTVISILGKTVLSLWQYRIGRRTNSDMLIANAKNMRNDIFISLSVFVGLFFTFVLKLPVLDLITAIAISIWIMKVAFTIFMDTSRELMDGVKDISVYNRIIKSVDDVKGAYNPHRIRVRKLADMLMIALDIEVDENISVSDAHRVAKNVERRLKEDIGNVYDVVVHIEPLGNVEKDENFGVSRNHLP